MEAHHYGDSGTTRRRPPARSPRGDPAGRNGVCLCGKARRGRARKSAGVDEQLAVVAADGRASACGEDLDRLKRFQDAALYVHFGDDIGNDATLLSMFLVPASRCSWTNCQTTMARLRRSLRAARPSWTTRWWRFRPFDSAFAPLRANGIQRCRGLTAGSKFAVKSPAIAPLTP